MDDAPGLCPDGRNKGVDEALLQALVGSDVVLLQVVHEVQELHNDIIGHFRQGIVIFLLAGGDIVNAELSFSSAKPSERLIWPKFTDH